MKKTRNAGLNKIAEESEVTQSEVIDMQTLEINQIGTETTKQCLAETMHLYVYNSKPSSFFSS